MSAPKTRAKLSGLRRLLRASVAGLAATASDMATLYLLVTFGHLHPRTANVPALLLGAFVNFVLNRRYAFRARAGSAAKQALGYSAVELIALAMNGALYEAVLRFLPGTEPFYALLRLATTCVVFLCWSYPLWRRVFRVPPRSATRPWRSAGGPS